MNSEIPRRWKLTTIGDEIQLQRGFDITKREMRQGSVPVLASGGISGFHDTAMSPGPGVVIGRKGTLGTAHYAPGPYWPSDTTLWVKEVTSRQVVYEAERVILA